LELETYHGVIRRQSWTAFLADFLHGMLRREAAQMADQGKAQNEGTGRDQQHQRHP
jgi:hypothetical protein